MQSPHRVNIPNALTFFLNWSSCLFKVLTQHLQLSGQSLQVMYDHIECFNGVIGHVSLLFMKLGTMPQI